MVRNTLAPIASRGPLGPPISFKVSQWLAFLTTFRSRVGGESILLRTTSMWPSLKRSPKAAPRAGMTAARPLPVAGGRSSEFLAAKIWKKKRKKGGWGERGKIGGGRCRIKK